MNSNANRQSIKYFNEAMSFWRSARIVQSSSARKDDTQLLVAPVIYLFRHTVELLLKGLIIRDGDELFESDIKDVVLPQGRRKLSQMHSLKLLFDVWESIRERMLIPAFSEDERKKVLRYINRIESIDPGSTYFRYPYSKDGNGNSRLIMTPVTKTRISSVPCSVGAIIHHEGRERFSCCSGGNRLARIEDDLGKLATVLIKQYSVDYKYQPMRSDIE